MKQIFCWNRKGKIKKGDGQEQLYHSLWGKASQNCEVHKNAKRKFMQ